MLKALIGPGERVMQRLRIPTKFGLLVIAVAVPMVMLVWLFLGKAQADIEFTRSERDGVAALQTYIPVLRGVIDTRNASRAKAGGFEPAAAAYEAARAKTDRALSQMQSQLAAQGDPLGVKPQVEKLVAAWKETASSSFGMGPDGRTAFVKVTELSIEVLQDLTDKSNLSLDPDVDSFYLINAQLLTMPKLLEDVGQLRGWSTFIAARKKPLTNVELRQYAAWASGVETGTGIVKGYIAKSQAATPALKTSVPTQPLDDVKAYAVKVNKQLFEATAESAATLDPNEFWGAGNQAMDALSGVYQSGLPALDKLLEARIHGLITSRDTAMAVVLVFSLIALYMLVAFYRSIKGGFSALTYRIDRLGQGDLTPSWPARGTDEMSVAINTLRSSVTNLAGIVGGVRSSAENIAVATEEISQGNQTLAAQGSRMAASVEETSAAMQSLSEAVQRNLDSAEQADRLTKQAYQVVERSGRAVTQAVDTMGKITHSSQKIGEIIQVIDGIAFQTNILALNAAVEAARAGEQGRGFAVVASEVRALAQRSAGAAKEIATLIQASLENVEQGAKQVNEAGATMKDVLTSVQKVTDIMGEIAAATNSQNNEIQQIATAVHEVDASTQQNAALVDEISAGADSLREQATNLAESVKVFKVDGKSV